MRMLYGVHGYGREHATRVLAVSRELTRSNEMRFLTGGNAHGLAAGECLYLGKAMPSITQEEPQGQPFDGSCVGAYTHRVDPMEFGCLKEKRWEEP